MPIRGNARSGKCHSWNCPSGKCPFGELSVGEKSVGEMTVGDLSAYQINNSGVLNQDFGMFTQPKNLIQTMKNNKKLI